MDYSSLINGMSYEELAQAYVQAATERDEFKSLYEQERDKNKNLEEKEKQDSAVIGALEDKIVHLTAELNNDGTTTGMSTGNTPPNKTKVIPATRTRKKGLRKRGRPSGGKKSTMAPIENVDKEETVIEEPESTVCDKCGVSLVPTGNCEEKTEYDVRVEVVKIVHRFVEYKCPVCGRKHRALIPNNLKEPCQYGNNIKAIVTSLYVTGNMSLNRVVSFVRGITLDRVSMSEGYICKLLRIGAALLSGFYSSLKELITRLTLLHWDDTVIMINTIRSCLRFYGNENLICFVVHEKKNLDGLLEDNILSSISPTTVVVHDHNMVNYNENFHFVHAECNVHLEREAAKVMAENPGHNWPQDIIDLIEYMYDQRDIKKKMGIMRFSEEEIDEFWDNWAMILEKARKQHESSSYKYGGKIEIALINRLEKYGENYFLWFRDFNIPSSNNLSERSLRPAKIRMKISGQFINIDRANDYAIIKSYTETCKKNGINETEALIRLYNGKPYTLDEILDGKTE